MDIGPNIKDLLECLATLAFLLIGLYIVMKTYKETT